MDLYCVYCGQSLPYDASFCNRCGRSDPFNLAQVNNSDTRALSQIPPPPQPTLPTPPYTPHNPYVMPISQVMETCEIGWSRRAYGLTARIIFHAEITAFRDSHIIASSEPVPDDRDNIGKATFIPRETYAAITAVNQLVERLIQDGWQPVRHGDHWWNYRFIRPTRY